VHASRKRSLNPDTFPDNCIQNLPLITTKLVGMYMMYTVFILFDPLLYIQYKIYIRVNIAIRTHESTQESVLTEEGNIRRHTAFSSQLVL